MQLQSAIPKADYDYQCIIFGRICPTMPKYGKDKICKDERNDLWMVKMPNRNLQVSSHTLSRGGGVRVAEQVRNLFFSPACSVRQGTVQAPVNDGVVSPSPPDSLILFHSKAKPRAENQRQDRIQGIIVVNPRNNSGKSKE